MLPCTKWIRNNHMWLEHHMKNHPELFAHIPKERKIHTINEGVELAEKLAADNNGILPRYVVIREKASWLPNHMIRSPKLFAHIPKEKNHTTKDAVKLAEKLAKANNGILPGHTFLKTNHSWILGHLKTYPKLLESFSNDDDMNLKLSRNLSCLFAPFIFLN